MIDLKDCKIDRIRGTGPGGQARNKKSTCVRITHRPTGIVVVMDQRSQKQNLENGLKELERRIQEEKNKRAAAAKKAARDLKIKTMPIIRTYDFKSQRVYDRRTGKQASLKSILEDGRLEQLR